jgi:16S rRNA (cytosine967-C5)-methyltransferase
VALAALINLERTAGRANAVVPDLLATSGLTERDRAFVTELVYGTERMRRACDWLVDAHLRRPVETDVRAALRLGAYQLAFLGTPPHAGVSATVAEVSGPARGLVNAVLRRVATAVAAGVAWPSDGVRLSYPDWIIDELTASLGHDAAIEALEQMNVPAQVTVRSDGYIQDRASQWTAAAVEAQAGELIVDLCAAPGGKATAMAERQPSLVVAGDVNSRRAALVAENVSRLRLDNVATVVLDATAAPFPSGVFDRVLVDAPCSGLGVLRRRPDARWRIQPDDVGRLAGLQRRLLDSALSLVAPGGRVVYGVCTLTAAETTEIDRWLASAHPDAEAVAPCVGPEWDSVGRGARLLPQAAGTDGMFLLVLQKRAR